MGDSNLYYNFFASGEAGGSVTTDTLFCYRPPSALPLYHMIFFNLAPTSETVTRPMQVVLTEEYLKSKVMGLECELTDMASVNVSRVDCQALTLEITVDVDQITLETKAQLVWTLVDFRSLLSRSNISIPALIAMVMLAAILLVASVGSFIFCYRRRRSDKREEKIQHAMPSISTTNNSDRDNDDIIELVKGLSRYPDLKNIVPGALRIPLERLTFGQEIGGGCFGRVLRGEYLPEPNAPSQAVAIKFLRNSEAGVRLFIAEGLIMKNFDHPHVLSLLGIAFRVDMPLVVTPLMANGDLERYLKSSKTLALPDLLRFSFDIANGMKYLSELKFVHRDLACRNCMLDQALCVKIADFGLCRNISKSEQYVVQHTTRLPCKWMPLESIEEGVFSEKSDVWAYAVTLWEIMSRCFTPPYADLSVAAYVRFLRNGGRLKRPRGCPAEIYAIMRECWNSVPEHRPGFADLSDKLPAAIDAVLNHVTCEAESGSLPTANALETNDEYELPNGVSSIGCAPMSYIEISRQYL